MWKILKESGAKFVEHDCMSMAASLSFYTAFSMPPMLLIIVAIAGFAAAEEQVMGELDQQIQTMIGRQAVEQAQVMIENIRQETSEGFWGQVFGVIALIFAATTAFAHLQASLNVVWRVKPDPRRSTIVDFLLKRILSFGLVVSIAFLLMVSFALSAALGIVSERIDLFLPSGLSSTTLFLGNFLLSSAIIAALFAALFKVLPDAEINWRDVWPGAVVTALLFSAGKELIGLYLGNNEVTTAFGASASLAVILLWTYYSANIVYAGAEITRAWTDRRGAGIAPMKGATEVVENVERLRDPNGNEDEIRRPEAPDAGRRLGPQEPRS